MSSFLDAIPGIGAAAGVAGGLFGILTGAHQNHLANKMHPRFTPYQASPYAQAQLGLAQQYFNGINPAYQQQIQQIGANGANYNNTVQRNATDGAQALALQSLNAGATNDAYGQAAQQQAQWKNSMLDNLNQAYGVMTSEGEKVWQSQMQKYQSEVATQNALRGAGTSNMAGGMNAIGSTLIGFGNYKK